MNKANKNGVPALRFPEFKNALEWQEKKLGAVATFLKGKGISKSDITINGKQPCIRYGELYTLYNEIINNINSHTNIPTKNLVLSKMNDVIIPASGETKEDIATASCVMNSDIALGGDLNIIRSKMNGIFLSYYLNNARKSAITQLSQGISVVHLYSSQLKKLDINIPSFLEQQKIADCLTSLDDLITAQSQKVDSLKQHKKGLMQQLFPQADANLPKLRFPAFKNAPVWKEKKLGDIGEFKTSSVNKKIVDGEKLVQLVNYMNVYKHEDINNTTIENLMTVSANETQLRTSNLKKGDILFTPSSETPDDIGHSVVVFENLKNTLYSYHLMRFRPKLKLDILYSHYFCNIDYVLKQISRVATGSTRFTISISGFSNIKIKLPSTVQEQQKIANCLTSLDDLITAQNQKIETLKQHKKGLMQKLFPEN